MESQAISMRDRSRKLLGNWLKDQRIKAGLSQEKVSKSLGYSGRTYIARFEGGYEALPFETLFDLANLYDIEVDEIVSKLREYEPEKAEKFDRLSEKFALYHLRSMQKASKRFAGSQAPAHHIPFPASFATASRSTHRSISLQKPDSLRNTLDILNCGGYPLRSAFYHPTAVLQNYFQVYSNIYYQKLHIFH